MTQNAQAQLSASRTALFAKSTSETLVASLIAVDALPRTPEHSMVRSWLIDELEQRFPIASNAVEQAFATADAEERATGEFVQVDYVAVLVDAIRSTSKS